MIFEIGGRAYYLEEKYFAPDWWDNWVNPRQKTGTFPKRLKRHRKD
jgi:hypothetical protein